jgi:hypothetical protein
MRPTQQQLREGHQRLTAWLPQALDQAKDGFGGEMSPLARATFAAVTLDNLEAVMIYPAPKGGWHADVTLKGVPPGVPNALGTPVQTPCRTQEEAETIGRGLLATVVSLIQAKSQEPAPPVFMLLGWTIPLIPEVFSEALKQMPWGKDGPYGTALQASARVEQILEELCPEGFNGDDFNKWPREKETQLMAVLHTAVLSGLFRYPMPKDGTPG